MTMTDIHETDRDGLRELIRSCAFDLKLPLVRRDIDLLIQQSADEQWNLWRFTAELLRREKENRSENQRRHRIKNAGFPQLRYLNEIDTDALPADARKALPTLETLDFIKTDATSFYTAIPEQARLIWRQLSVSPHVMPDTRCCSHPCQDCSRRYASAATL